MPALRRAAVASASGRPGRPARFRRDRGNPLSAGQPDAIVRGRPRRRTQQRNDRERGGGAGRLRRRCFGGRRAGGDDRDRRSGAEPRRRGPGPAPPDGARRPRRTSAVEAPAAAAPALGAGGDVAAGPPPAPVEHARRLSAGRRRRLHQARPGGARRDRRGRLRAGGIGAGAGADRAVARPRAGVECDRRSGQIRAAAGGALGSLPRMRPGRRRWPGRRGRARALPALRRAPGAAPARQPCRHHRADRRRLHIISAGQFVSGADHHPLWPHRLLYDPRRGARSGRGGIVAIGAARARCLDHRAGAEARRAYLVPGGDPAALGAAPAPAHRALPLCRLHRALVEHRRFHGLDRCGAGAVRDLDDDRARAGDRQLRWRRRADDVRGQRL